MLTFPINHWSGGEIPTNGLRFSSVDGNRLVRTPTVVGNRNLWTLAAWVKRGQLTAIQYIWGVDTVSADGIGFNATDQFIVTIAGTARLVSTPVYRDPNAWMHVVVAFDAANVTATNRIRVYINGAEITTWATDARAALAINVAKTNTLVQHRVGQGVGAATNFDGYMADTYLIDGAALAPTAFGAFDADNIWQPGPQYAGAYGTNGFFMNTTDMTVPGLDSGPNGNNYALAGTWRTDPADARWHGSYDSPTDNYCVLTPLFRTGSTIRGGGLDLTDVVTDPSVAMGSFGITKGKWYWEVNYVSGAAGSFAGIINNTASEATNGRVNFPGADATGYSLRYSTGNKVTADATGVGVAHGSPIAVGDTVMVAFDADNRKLWFGKNGAWFGGGDPAAGTGEAFSAIPMTREVWFPAHGNNLAGGVNAYNFGQRDFKHVPPAGFGKLRASSLDPVAIIDGEDYFEVKTYTGTGAAQSVTGVQFQPDLVAVYARSAQTPQNAYYDVARGVQRRWSADETLAEVTADLGLTAFNVDGFSLGTGGAVNTAARNYAAYAWKQGTVPGLQIVTYTGDGVAGRNIAHTLGKKPAMVWIKRRDTAVGSVAYHQYGGFPAAPETGAMPIDGTGTGQGNTWVAGVSYWNNTAPTATQFTLGNDAKVNAAGGTYVAYVWVEVEGFSKFGYYRQNAVVDGPHMFCGFRPQLWWCFETSTLAAPTGSDDARNPFNLQGAAFRVSATGATESTTDDVDFVSSGVKVRIGTSQVNNSSATNGYAFVAFAKHPFKHGRAR